MNYFIINGFVCLLMMCSCNSMEPKITHIINDTSVNHRVELKLVNYTNKTIRRLCTQSQFGLFNDPLDSYEVCSYLPKYHSTCSENHWVATLYAFYKYKLQMRPNHFLIIKLFEDHALAARQTFSYDQLPDCIKLSILLENRLKNQHKRAPRIHNGGRLGRCEPHSFSAKL